MPSTFGFFGEKEKKQSFSDFTANARGESINFGSFGSFANAGATNDSIFNRGMSANDEAEVTTGISSPGPNYDDLGAAGFREGGRESSSSTVEYVTDPFSQHERNSFTDRTTGEAPVMSEAMGQLGPERAAAGPTEGNDAVDELSAFFGAPGAGTTTGMSREMYEAYNPHGSHPNIPVTHAEQAQADLRAEAVQTSDGLRFSFAGQSPSYWNTPTSPEPINIATAPMDAPNQPPIGAPPVNPNLVSGTPPTALPNLYANVGREGVTDTSELQYRETSSEQTATDELSATDDLEGKFEEPMPELERVEPVLHTTQAAHYPIVGHEHQHEPTHEQPIDNHNNHHIENNGVLGAEVITSAFPENFFVDSRLPPEQADRHKIFMTQYLAAYGNLPQIVTTGIVKSISMIPSDFLTDVNKFAFYDQAVVLNMRINNLENSEESLKPILLLKDPYFTRISPIAFDLLQHLKMGRLNEFYERVKNNHEDAFVALTGLKTALLAVEDNVLAQLERALIQSIKESEVATMQNKQALQDHIHPAERAHLRREGYIVHGERIDEAHPFAAKESGVIDREVQLMMADKNNPANFGSKLSLPLSVSELNNQDFGTQAGFIETQNSGVGDADRTRVVTSYLVPLPAAPPEERPAHQGAAPHVKTEDNPGIGDNGMLVEPFDHPAYAIMPLANTLEERMAIAAFEESPSLEPSPSPPPPLRKKDPVEPIEEKAPLPRDSEAIRQQLADNVFSGFSGFQITEKKPAVRPVQGPARPPPGTIVRRRPRTTAATVGNPRGLVGIGMRRDNAMFSQDRDGAVDTFTQQKKPETLKTPNVLPDFMKRQRQRPDDIPELPFTRVVRPKRKKARTGRDVLNELSSGAQRPVKKAPQRSGAVSGIPAGPQADASVVRSDRLMPSSKQQPTSIGGSYNYPGLKAVLSPARATADNRKMTQIDTDSLIPKKGEIVRQVRSLSRLNQAQGQTRRPPTVRPAATRGGHARRQRRPQVVERVLDVNKYPFMQNINQRRLNPAILSAIERSVFAKDPDMEKTLLSQAVNPEQRSIIHAFMARKRSMDHAKSVHHTKPEVDMTIQQFLKHIQLSMPTGIEPAKYYEDMISVSDLADFIPAAGPAEALAKAQEIKKEIVAVLKKEAGLVDTHEHGVQDLSMSYRYVCAKAAQYIKQMKNKAHLLPAAQLSEDHREAIKQAQQAIAELVYNLKYMDRGRRAQDIYQARHVRSNLRGQGHIPVAPSSAMNLIQAEQMWYTIPNVPGLSAVTDLARLRQQVLNYKKSAAYGQYGKKSKAQKRVEIILGELAEEENDLYTLVKTVQAKGATHGELNDITAIQFKHAKKVERLIDCYNSLLTKPAQQRYRLTGYYRDHSKYTHFDENFPMKNDMVVELKSGEVGRVTAKVGDKYVITLTNGNKSYLLLDEMQRVESEAIFYDNDNSTRKSLGIIDGKLISFLRLGNNTVVHMDGSFFNEYEKKNIIPLRAGGDIISGFDKGSAVRMHILRMNQRHTSTGYFNVRHPPVRGDQVEFTRETGKKIRGEIIDPDVFIAKAQPAEVYVMKGDIKFDAAKHFLVSTPDSVYVAPKLKVRRIHHATQLPQNQMQRVSGDNRATTGPSSAATRTAKPALMIGEATPAIRKHAEDKLTQLFDHSFQILSGLSIKARQAQGKAREELLLSCARLQGFLDSVANRVKGDRIRQANKFVEFRHAHQALHRFNEMDKRAQYRLGHNTASNHYTANTERAKTSRLANAIYAHPVHPKYQAMMDALRQILNPSEYHQCTNFINQSSISEVTAVQFLEQLTIAKPGIERQKAFAQLVSIMDAKLNKATKIRSPFGDAYESLVKTFISRAHQIRFAPEIIAAKDHVRAMMHTIDQKTGKVHKQSYVPAGRRIVNSHAKINPKELSTLQSSLHTTQRVQGALENSTVGINPNTLVQTRNAHRPPVPTFISKVKAPPLPEGAPKLPTEERNKIDAALRQTFKTIWANYKGQPGANNATKMVNAVNQMQQFMNMYVSQHSGKFINASSFILQKKNQARTEVEKLPKTTATAPAKTATGVQARQDVPIMPGYPQPTTATVINPMPKVIQAKLPRVDAPKQQRVGSSGLQGLAAATKVSIPKQDIQNINKTKISGPTHSAGAAGNVSQVEPSAVGGQKLYWTAERIAKEGPQIGKIRQIQNTFSMSPAELGSGGDVAFSTQVDGEAYTRDMNAALANGTEVATTPYTIVQKVATDLGEMYARKKKSGQEFINAVADFARNIGMPGGLVKDNTVIIPAQDDKADDKDKKAYAQSWLSQIVTYSKNLVTGQVGYDSNANEEFHTQRATEGYLSALNSVAEYNNRPQTMAEKAFAYKEVVKQTLAPGLKGPAAVAKCEQLKPGLIHMRGAQVKEFLKRAQTRHNILQQMVKISGGKLNMVSAEESLFQHPLSLYRPAILTGSIDNKALKAFFRNIQLLRQRNLLGQSKDVLGMMDMIKNQGFKSFQDAKDFHMKHHIIHETSDLKASYHKAQLLMRGMISTGGGGPNFIVDKDKILKFIGRQINDPKYKDSIKETSVEDKTQIMRRITRDARIKTNYILGARFLAATVLTKPLSEGEKDVLTADSMDDKLVSALILYNRNKITRKTLQGLIKNRAGIPAMLKKYGAPVFSKPDYERIAKIGKEKSGQAYLDELSNLFTLIPQQREKNIARDVARRKLKRNHKYILDVIDRPSVHQPLKDLLAAGLRNVSKIDKDPKARATKRESLLMRTLAFGLQDIALVPVNEKLKRHVVPKDVLQILAAHDKHIFGTGYIKQDKYNLLEDLKPFTRAPYRAHVSGELTIVPPNKLTGLGALAALLRMPKVQEYYSLPVNMAHEVVKLDGGIQVSFPPVSQERSSNYPYQFNLPAYIALKNQTPDVAVTKMGADIRKFHAKTKAKLQATKDPAIFKYSDKEFLLHMRPLFFFKTMEEAFEKQQATQRVYGEKFEIRENDHGQYLVQGVIKETHSSYQGAIDAKDAYNRQIDLQNQQTTQPADGVEIANVDLTPEQRRAKYSHYIKGTAGTLKELEQKTDDAGYTIRLFKKDEEGNEMARAYVGQKCRLRVYGTIIEAKIRSLTRAGNIVLIQSTGIELPEEHLSKKNVNPDKTIVKVRPKGYVHIGGTPEGTPGPETPFVSPRMKKKEKAKKEAIIDLTAEEESKIAGEEQQIKQERSKSVEITARDAYDTEAVAEEILKKNKNYASFLQTIKHLHPSNKGNEWLIDHYLKTHDILKSNFTDACELASMKMILGEMQRRQFSFSPEFVPDLTPPDYNALPVVRDLSMARDAEPQRDPVLIKEGSPELLSLFTEYEKKSHEVPKEELEDVLADLKKIQDELQHRGYQFDNGKVITNNIDNSTNIISPAMEEAAELAVSAVRNKDASAVATEALVKPVTGPAGSVKPAIITEIESEEPDADIESQAETEVIQVKKSPPKPVSSRSPSSSTSGLVGYGSAPRVPPKPPKPPKPQAPKPGSPAEDHTPQPAKPAEEPGPASTSTHAEHQEAVAPSGEDKTEDIELLPKLKGPSGGKLVPLDGSGNDFKQPATVIPSVQSSGKQKEVTADTDAASTDAASTDAMFGMDGVLSRSRSRAGSAAPSLSAMSLAVDIGLSTIPENKRPEGRQAVVPTPDFALLLPPGAGGMDALLSSEFTGTGAAPQPRESQPPRAVDEKEAEEKPVKVNLKVHKRKPTKTRSKLPRFASTPAKEIGAFTVHHGVPPGYYDIALAEEKPKHGPLFKYGSVYDILKEFNINEKIYVRVYKQGVETVFLKGVQEASIKTVAWILNHLIGTLFVNTPTPEDTSKLRHIFNVTEKSVSMDIMKAMLKHLDTTSFPLHYYLATKNAVMGSALLPNTNDLTVARVYKAFQGQNKEYQEMVL